MKRIILLIITLSMTISAAAQLPEGYDNKTAKLAENLVKASKKGSYNKTYNALRNIQKYEYRLDKEQLVRFYTDLHMAVDKACDTHGIEKEGKEEMRIIIDALFSDDLKSEINVEK